MAVVNVDNNEIEKFSALASKWWDLNGEFKPLHDINPVRLAFIEEKSQGLFSKDILDVGCGGGILAESMAKAGASVTGIDLAKDSLDVASLHGLESGVKVNYELTSAEDYAQANPESMDIVTCLEMLEHVPDPASVIQACAKIVKPGGKVFFSTINRNMKSWVMAILGAEYVLNLVPKGTHDHKKFITPAEMTRWIDTTSLVPKNITGLHLNVINNTYYLSDKNVDVNYILQCEKLR
ncbi:bifunctional 2-polyprenyl-6-hydroxyphenol methylase/3-demethylubiquinol 3-O-methyltransferase UbiG [Glaciecola sp.]|jgi:2-polyprenyl-6-hydroxyphenyl methylase/3-demethylubiquinone-9 3-methyltransferase|uniref:bifunctional 2-polyprenyl-6-hydroxyphenol methylase/3-demethylubiquinol 3-O-methyltransferase UbiG n=1 Tax=Glaciecola sp. MF2-115 TaxID=3384827 RepID=UPI00398A4EB5